MESPTSPSTTPSSRTHPTPTIATTPLVNSTYYRQVLQSICEMVVPQLADWCAVDVPNEGHLQLLAVAHINHQKIRAVKKMHYAILDDAVARQELYNALKTGQSKLYPYLSLEALQPLSANRKLFKLIKTTNPTAIMIIPLVARRKTIGIITLVSTSSHRIYTNNDLKAAQNLADRAAIAIDNAQLFQKSRDELKQRRSIEATISQLASIIQSTDDAVLSYKLNKQITSWNPAAERLYGYTAKEAIGKSINFIVPNDRHEEWEEVHEVIRLDQGIEHFETVRQHKDGHLIDVSITYSPLKNSAGKIIGTAALARDITERRKLEKRKDDFIIMASHELKTPITSLKVFTQLLQNQVKETPQLLNQLNKMDGQLNRLSALVNDLLDISKIESGKLELHKENFSINELLLDTIEIIQGITPNHQLIFQSTDTIEVYGDRDRINQVIINLITNAIKYSPGADKVEVELAQHDNCVELSITDHGIGISNEHQAKIFERFFRVSGSSDTFPGLGIGLYLSAEIIHRHGGQITVKSQPNHGSTFMVRLPTK